MQPTGTMSETTPTEGKAKHAWFEVSRSAPPKRSAQERVADFLEIYGSYDEETAREQASRCLECPEALCVQGCPLENRIPEWMMLTAEGQFLEAAALTRSTSNMPEICGRVCPQDRLCEGACILNGKAEPVSIGAVERFLNEYAFARYGVDAAQVSPNGFKVAVLGSGPGGMSCADELAKRGYAVTVFESQPVPGGLLVNGIPAFKLEKTVIERRIDMLKQRGVEFRLGVEVGKDIDLQQIRDTYDAVFLGFGAQDARPLKVPGADLSGVSQALPFIIQHNTDVPLDIPPVEAKNKRVIVLGGGDTAMDCLRTALRLGAKESICVYRRDEANMPGSRREVENSVDEGARFMFLVNAIEVLGDDAGNVRAVKCVRMELGAPDSSGRRRPSAVPGSEFELEADVVLVSYGFDAVPFPKDSDLHHLAVDDWGTVVIDSLMMTSVPGVFAGGDLVRGPSLVVNAVRDGRKAAQEIHRYLTCRRLGDVCGDQTDHISPESV